MSNFVLYLSGADRLPEPLQKSEHCGVLNSFAIGAKKLDAFIMKQEADVFIDSGAYSVKHSNIPVDIDQYIEFINRTDSPKIFAAFDVIPEHFSNKAATAAAEESWENYIYMMERIKEDRRDKVIPLYHQHEPYDALKRILNTEVCGRLAPYIGFGGGRPSNKKDIRNYYATLFTIIKKSKNPKVKTHAFGLTSLDILPLFPFTSADSTTWLQTSINGKIHCYKNTRTIVVSTQQKESRDYIHNINPAKKALILEEIEKYGKGVTLEELGTDYNKRLKYNRDFFVWWAEHYKYEPMKIWK